MKFSRFPFTGLTMALVVLNLAGTGQILVARPLGIDVSSYQGSGINWGSVAGAGITFAWAKATEGTGITDSTYAGNISRGKAAGVYMGGYDFAHPESNTPAQEAAHFWSVTGGNTKADGLTLNPMLDMEVFSGITGDSSYSAWVNDWCTDIVQDAANNGVKFTPVIYVSACNANRFNSTVAQWYDDIADYNGEDPQTGTPWSVCSSYNVWGGWDFWQYTSSGSISGISGNVDHDVFSGTAATLLSAQVASANTNSTIFYWDPQKAAIANPYTGSMTGTWESSLWSPGSAGQATPLAWVNGKAACFGVHTGSGTPAYTVTMNSSHVVAGFFDGPLTPNSCDVTITGTGVINLASGPQALDSVNATDGSLGKLRIYCDIAGSGKLYPEGNGQSYLHGNNSFTGGMELGYHDSTSTNAFNGIVNFNNGSAFGSGTITLTSHGTGGALVLEGTAAATVPNAVSVVNATTNNIVGNAAGLTFSGNWSIGANLLTLGAGGTAGNKTIISGVVSGTAGLTVYNAGTVVLSGVNTFSGKTTITSPAVLTIDGAGLLGGGSYSGAMVNGGTFNYSSSASQTLSGIISGAGPLLQSDVGTLILTGVNTYAGATTVGLGSTLCVTADSGLGAVTSTLTLNGGCLKNNNSAPNISPTRTITLGAAGGYLDAGWAPANALTIRGKITGSGALLINLDGSPIVLTNTANNYTGNTIIGANGPGSFASGTQAWLKLGNSGVIPNGAGFGNVIINQASLGLLDLAGFSQTINGLSGDGIVDNTAGNGSLSVGNNNATSTFNGVIQDTVGTLTLTKIGAGTLTIGGSNTFGGNTIISAGTLALGSAGSINTTPKISLAAGATFDVSAVASFALSGVTTLSAGGAATPATIKGGAAISFGSQPIILACDGSHPALTISQGTLSLNANPFTVNGAQLPVGTYTIIQQTSGSIAASGNSTVTGTAIGAAGTVASLSANGGNLVLTIANTTTTTLGPLTNSAVGQTVTFTAAIAPAPSAGTVQFYDNTVALGSPVAVTGATASYSTSTLAAGSHPITASFSGATGYAASATLGSSIQQITNSSAVVLHAANASFQANGTFQFTFTGSPGGAYLIEAATDLNLPVIWITLSTNTADSNGLVTFTDTDATNHNVRYYRTALP